MEVEIDLIERKQKNKSTTSALRRSGQIPCVIYSKGQIGETFSIPKVAFEEVVRRLEMGFLSTTIFNLKTAAGKKRRAIVREIQYKPTTYEVSHIDFLELIPDHKIEMKVPLTCLGEADCVGVKAGGYLRRVKESITIRCLPKDIPTHFEVDISDVDIRQAKTVADLKSVPKGIDIRLPQNQVIATVMK